jgi:hypothetical protein
MIDRALQNQSLEQEQDSELPNHVISLDQPGSSTDRREERAKATHRAHLEDGELPMMEMDVRWEKVRNQPNLPKPTADSANVQKTLKVVRLGKSHTQEMYNTDEEGTSIVTFQDDRVGITKTIQGCREGAWLEDTTGHMELLAVNVDQVSQEILASMYTNFENAQADVRSGRRSGPMLATMGTGHFGYYRNIEGGSAESMAVTRHFGLIGPEVFSQIPMANVDPNQSPVAPNTEDRGHR